jgi:hypothetical protein
MAQILERADRDTGFRARLIAEPRSVIEGEFGVTVPDGAAIRVVEEGVDEHYIVLPPIGGHRLDSDTQEPPLWGNLGPDNPLKW